MKTLKVLILFNNKTKTWKEIIPQLWNETLNKEYVILGANRVLVTIAFLHPVVVVFESLAAFLLVAVDIQSGADKDGKFTRDELFFPFLSLRTVILPRTILC